MSNERKKREQQLITEVEYVAEQVGESRKEIQALITVSNQPAVSTDLSVLTPLLAEIRQMITAVSDRVVLLEQNMIGYFGQQEELLMVHVAGNNTPPPNVNNVNSVTDESSVSVGTVTPV